MKHYITPEEHARMQRRRGRQALGLLVAILVIVGFVTVLRAGVGAVANLFDDTAQKQEYEDKLEGLVLFDPMPFDGIENIDDLTLREAAVWGCIYSIQETQGGFDNYNTDPDTEQLLLPSLDVDAYLAKLLGPGFKLTHRSFEMEDMTIEFDDATQCYKIPVTGTVGYYRAVVTKLFKRSGKLHVTVGLSLIHIFHQLTQPSVGGNAACQTHLLCAGVRCGQQQLFGQNARNAVLKAGGKVGHIDFFALHLGLVHLIEHGGFQAGKAHVVLAVHMGHRQAIGLGVAGLGGIGHAGAAGIGQTQRAGHLVKGFTGGIVHRVAENVEMCIRDSRRRKHKCRAS